MSRKENEGSPDAFGKHDEDITRRAETTSPRDEVTEEAQEAFEEEYPAAVEKNAGEDPALNDDSITDRSVILSKDGATVAKWALRFIIIIAAGYILRKGLGVLWIGLLPAILALLISTVLWPPVKFMRGNKVPPALATIITMVGAFGIVGGIFAAIAPSISSQIPQLADQAQKGLNRLLQWIQGPPLNLELGELEEELDNLINTATDFLQNNSQNIASGVFSGVSMATSVLTTAVITLVLVFFFLKDGVRFLPWLRTYTGGNIGWHLTEVLTRTWNTLCGFIRTQAIVSFVDAFFIGVGLLILDVPLALALAVITFFGGFIPIIGAFTAGALAVVVALVTNGLTNALLVLALILIVQQLEGNVLQPMLQSKAMNLHAAMVLLAVTIGSGLFGILGAFLAVPVAASIAVWVRYHSEMVALRAGEITIEDIEIATSKGETMTPSEAFNAVKDNIVHMAKKITPGKSTD